MNGQWIGQQHGMLLMFLGKLDVRLPAKEGSDEYLFMSDIRGNLYVIFKGQFTGIASEAVPQVSS